jgi:hypothetical protein
MGRDLPVTLFQNSKVITPALFRYRSELTQRVRNWSFLYASIIANAARSPVRMNWENSEGETPKYPRHALTKSTNYGLGTKKYSMRQVYNDIDIS